MVNRESLAFLFKSDELDTLFTPCYDLFFERLGPLSDGHPEHNYLDRHININRSTSLKNLIINYINHCPKFLSIKNDPNLKDKLPLDLLKRIEFDEIKIPSTLLNHSEVYVNTMLALLRVWSIQAKLIECHTNY